MSISHHLDKPELTKWAATIWVSCLAVLLVGCASGDPVAAASKSRYRIAEDKLGPLPETYAVAWQVNSKTGSHFACVASQGKKQVVFVDGRPSQEFDAVSKDTPIFSPDGRHVAYTARMGRDWFVFVDGKPGQPCALVYAGTLRFSSDGKHLAYAAYKNGKCFIVIDGREQQTWDTVGDIASASTAKGMRVAYVAQQGQKWRVVVDGELGPEFSAVAPGTLKKGSVNGIVIFD